MTGKSDTINIHEYSVSNKSVSLNVQNIKDHANDITCMQFNKKEKLLVAGSLDKHI